MSEPSNDAFREESPPTLGRLARGLSALFWGIPITLLVSAQTQIFNWIRPHGILLPVIANGLLLYGLVQVEAFRRGDREWQSAVERAKILALANTGLAPFLFFWSKMPREPYFSQVVALVVIIGLLFLFMMNAVVRRLAAMAPDPIVREDSRVVTRMNRWLLLAVIVLLAAYLSVASRPDLPPAFERLLRILGEERHYLLVILVLFPVAMTMTLIWKIKEVVFQTVFASPATSAVGRGGSEL